MIMKITGIYTYPVKSLRGIRLQSATLTPQGVQYDRILMLLRTSPDAFLPRQAVKMSKCSQCALFSQELVTDPDQEGQHDSIRRSHGPTHVRVRYHAPPPNAKDRVDNGGAKNDYDNALLIPLDPPTKTLPTVQVDLYTSKATAAYAMGATPYDAWFTARFGFHVQLVYIGDGRRAALGKTMALPSPAAANTQPQSGRWLSSYLPPAAAAIPASLMGLLPFKKSLSPTSIDKNKTGPYLTFTDISPLLITSESSLSDLSSRLGLSPAEKEDEDFMYKFRPNIVTDGAGEPPWAEDFWAELTVTASSTPTTACPSVLKIVLTGNCGRCTSIVVDYVTGRPALGPMGDLLKTMQRDRRIDPGSKYSPVFGRYGYLSGGDGGGEMNKRTLTVGDEVRVTRRNTERTVFDWPSLTTLPEVKG